MGARVGRLRWSVFKPPRPTNTPTAGPSLTGVDHARVDDDEGEEAPKGAQAGPAAHGEWRGDLFYGGLADNASAGAREAVQAVQAGR